jgi:hypothetical protein
MVAGASPVRSRNTATTTPVVPHNTAARTIEDRWTRWYDDMTALRE